MSTNKRSWNDVQMAIAATSIALTLLLWNMFAGPDREKAAQKAAQQPQAAPPPTEAPVALQPAPFPIQKIIFGGASAPQTVIVQQAKGGGGNGGGASGGTTGSS